MAVLVVILGPIRWRRVVCVLRIEVGSLSSSIGGVWWSGDMGSMVVLLCFDFVSFYVVFHLLVARVLCLVWLWV